MQEERSNIPSVATSSHHPSPSASSSYTASSLTEDFPASGPFAFGQNHSSLRCSQAPRSAPADLSSNATSLQRPALTFLAKRATCHSLPSCPILFSISLNSPWHDTLYQLFDYCPSPSNKSWPHQGRDVAYIASTAWQIVSAQ